MRRFLERFLIYGFTLFWLAGYLEFHLHFLPLVWGSAPSAPRMSGVSVLFAAVIYLLALFCSRTRIRKTMQEMYAEFSDAPLLFKSLVFLTLTLFCVGAVQSFYPPNLSQESDAINYHMTLARQHLLHGSLAWLRWSAADLWPMPIQFGMAPTWFMGPHLHKVPQYLAAVNLLAVLLILGRNADPTHSWRGWVPALAFFTTHGIMIQLGTAMIDLAILYVLFVAFHAFVERSIVSLAIHLAIFLTAKAFSPVQGTVVFLTAVSLGFIFYRGRFSFSRFTQRAALLCAVFAGVLLIRSAWLGIEYAGTPLYPFFTRSTAPTALFESARAHLATRNAYGFGRGLAAFLKHFWLVSVPTEGVNNAYDYPLGLAWPLLLALSVFTLFDQWRRSKVGDRMERASDGHDSSHALSHTAGVLAIAFWIAWWLGSHQSRWLFPVLAFGWLATINAQRSVAPRILLACVCISGTLSLFSQLRAYQSTFRYLPSAIQTAEEAKIHAREIAPGVLSTRDALFYDRTILRIEPPDRMWTLPVESIHP